jgi:hypothetical protein
VSRECSHDGEAYDMAGATSSPPSNEESDPPKKSTATKLVELAEKRYQLGCTPDGEPYAIPLEGPPIVRLLRGGRQSLRAELSQAFYDNCGVAPSQSALADACTVLEGKAQRIEPVELHLRVAEHQGWLVLDLGDTTGRAVVIDSIGWRVVDVPPVLFKRTALTGALPEPSRDGTLDQLWSSINVGERYRPLLAAVLIAALMPNIPHPATLFTGEHGTGKSTTTKRLAQIIDPSPAQLRKAPRDADTATTAAAGSWMPALDNLSSMPDWLSDSICRWCTGDGDVRRRLYTDGDLHVISFRRVPVLNGIDLGALRGDLADRTVHLVLDRIPDSERRDDAEMAEAWQQAWPQVLGAVLDLAVKVLGALPNVHLDERPRMADFAKILAAVDTILGTEGLKAYLNLRTELAEDAATSDPLLIAIAENITTEFTGTSAELLAAVEPEVEKWKPPKDWPASARALTGQMRRHAPTLRRLGWVVTELDRAASRSKQVRWQLNPPDGPRGSAKDAANAAVAANAAFPQVNGCAAGAANGAATVRQTDGDAAGAANDESSPHDAALFAAPSTPHLTCENEDHAANAAFAASFTHLLAESSSAALEPPLHRPRPCPSCSATSTAIEAGHCTRCQPAA